MRYNIRECLLSTRYAPCTWFQHASIAGSLTFLSQYLDPNTPEVTLVVATLASAAFIYRELQGPDKHPPLSLPWYRRLVNGLDRTMDWVSPTVISFGIAVSYYLGVTS